MHYQVHYLESLWYWRDKAFNDFAAYLRNRLSQSGQMPSKDEEKKARKMKADLAVIHQEIQKLKASFAPANGKQIDEDEWKRQKEQTLATAHAKLDDLLGPPPTPEEIKLSIQEGMTLAMIGMKGVHINLKEQTATLGDPPIHSR
jgi:hypothetical protein